MNILFLMNDLSNTCGVTSHCYNLIKGLREKSNINVFIICGGGDAIGKFQDLQVFIRPNKLLSYEKRSFLRYLMGIIYIYRFIKKYEIQIIHSHHHYHANIAYTCSKFLNTATILTNHGLIPDIGKLNHFSADFIIAVNEHIKNYLISEKMIESKRIFLIRSGVYHDEEELLKKTALKIKFISASRLVKEKGMDIYFKAVSNLEEIYLKKSEFYFAGKGNYETELLELNKSNKLKYLGEVNNLKKHLKHYDVFVIPSESDSEGFPITVIEAAFAKCLIITSNFRGVEYVVKDKIDGLIFEKGNYRDLSDKIRYVIDNFSSLNNISENFHCKAQKLFDINVMVNKTINLYHECLSG